MKQMTLPQITLLILTILIGTFGSQASQQYKLAGSVQMQGGAPAEDGFINLYRSTDSTLLHTIVTTAGRFEFGLVDTGNYLIQFVGDNYQSALITLLHDRDNNLTLTVERELTKLKEVAITAHKNPFSFSRGNIKAQVANTSLSAIPDAIEVISKLPTVQVSADRENVNVLGKGEPLIYLDHQRITLNELGTLSVNDILEIEVINHPSASYEAEGRAVILVRRRRNSQSGFKGDITETPSLKRYFEHRTGINTSWKTGNTEWKANVQHSFATRFEGIKGDLNSYAFNYQSNYDGTAVGPRNLFLFGIGMYRQLGESDYFQWGINGRSQTDLDDVNTLSNITQNGSAIHATTASFNTGSKPFVNASINYQKKIKGWDGTLFAGAQYSQNQIYNTAAVKNDYDGKGLVPTESRAQSFLVHVGVARIDYKTTLGKAAEWESGLNYSMSRSTSLFDIKYFPANNGMSTNYSYAEDIAAAYTTITGTKGKWQYNTGLRYELTNVDGRYRDSSGVALQRTNGYLFPKVQLTYPLDSLRSFTLTVARSISRPNYANASQVSNYITPFLEWSNNINIYPAINNELSLNYSQPRYSVDLTVYTGTNPSWYITRYDSSLNKVRMINTNLDRISGASITIAVPYTYRKLTTTNYAVVQMDKVQDERAIQTKLKPNFYFYSSNQLQLPRAYTITASAWVNTAQRQGVFQRREQFSVDLAVSHTFFKKLTATIGAYDIFRSLNYVESYSINDIHAATTFVENQREFALSLKYSFGKLKDSKYTSRVVNEEGKRLN